MLPDTDFTLILIVRMAITAGFVLAATITAERAGPLIGGLVATLPLGAGPVYVFLALDHGATFIGHSAVNSLAINSVNVIFALTYARLAQMRSVGVSIGVGLVVWVVLALVVHAIPWTLLTGVLLNIVVQTVCIVLARPLRHVVIPRPETRWSDYALRATLVALLVGTTVTASFHIGPEGSGILAVFPIILISVQFILHRRVGGRPSAAVMANAVTGLVGFALACVVLHVTAEPFGSVIGLSLALATSIGWGLFVFGLRKRGIDL
ncbi:MAG TPA: hypothetical protein VHT93_04030 [Pseudolabrys sp.]|jgi:hypothetical protein|nr:hypothetical protein [Pseudolabrys sp.]